MELKNNDFKNHPFYNNFTRRALQKNWVAIWIQHAAYADTAYLVMLILIHAMYELEN